MKKAIKILSICLVVVLLLAVILTVIFKISDKKKYKRTDNKPVQTSELITETTTEKISTEELKSTENITEMEDIETTTEEEVTSWMDEKEHFEGIIFTDASSKEGIASSKEEQDRFVEEAVNNEKEYIEFLFNYFWDKDNMSEEEIKKEAENYRKYLTDAQGPIEKGAYLFNVDSIIKTFNAIGFTSKHKETVYLKVSVHDETNGYISYNISGYEIADITYKGSDPFEAVIPFQDNVYLKDGKVFRLKTDINAILEPEGIDVTYKKGVNKLNINGVLIQRINLQLFDQEYEGTFPENAYDEYEWEGYKHGE